MGDEVQVHNIWKRIEPLLQAHAPEIMESLAAGATPVELDNLESSIGLKLPSDLRRSLEIHNGQHDPSQCLKFCGTMSLMSTSDILRDWQMLTELAKDFDRQNGVYLPQNNNLNCDWWRHSCIPFGHCEGYYTCVDTNPAPGLKAGRIVEHTHDDAMEETNMSSFTQWLECVASALEASRFDRKLYGYFKVHPKFACK